MEKLQKITALVCCSCGVLFAQGKDDDGKLYFGVRVGTSNSSYFIDAGKSDLKDWDFDSKQREYGGESFDCAVFISLQSGIFAFQTEAIFTEFYYSSSEREFNEYNRSPDDWGWKYAENKYKTSRYAFVFPLLFKLAFRPNNVFIQTFAGPHLCVNVGGLKVKQNPEEEWYVPDFWFHSIVSSKSRIKKEPYPWGLTVGTSFGAKAKNGVVFFDIRYFTDLGTFNQGYQWISANGRSAYYCNHFLSYRTKISLTVGYEFGNGIDIKR